MNAIICDRCKICLAIANKDETAGTVWFRVTVHNEPYDLCRGCKDYVSAFLNMEDGLPTVAEWAKIKYAHEMKDRGTRHDS